MIPFTEDIYWNHFANYLDAYWPLPLLAVVLGVGSLLALRSTRWWVGPSLSVFLAAFWLWTGGVYFLLHYGQLVWAGPIFAGAFVIQGALIVWTGIVKRRLEPKFDASVAGWIGLGACVLAFVIGPLLAPEWKQSPLFGVTPGPVALYTLGLVLLNRGRVYYHLLPIPLFWLIVDGATLYLIDHPAGLVMPLAGLLMLVVGVRKNFK